VVSCDKKGKGKKGKGKRKTAGLWFLTFLLLTSLPSTFYF